MTARVQPRHRLLAALSLFFVLAGCAHPAGSAGARGHGSAAPSNQPPAVPRVTKPWKPGMPQLGVNVYWEDSKDDSDEVTRAKARRTINYLVALNANSVAVNFPFVMNGAYGNRVQPDPQYTPSPERLAIFLEEAAASRMRVTLRPVLDERSLVTAWRGKIEPSNRSAWFTSYANFLRQYAEVGQENGVAELVVGVELNSLQRDPRWVTLIASLRKVFPGTLSYSDNFDVFQRGLGAPAVDNVGVDAYFSVDAADTASVDQLAAAWQRWITTYAGARANSLVLHEVGIAAQNGAYQHPASWGSEGVSLNLTVQRNWFEAACRAAKSTHLAGLYFWNVRLHSNPGHEDPLHEDRLTFVDRPAESAVRTCFGEFGG